MCILSLVCATVIFSSLVAHVVLYNCIYCMSQYICVHVRMCPCVCVCVCVLTCVLVFVHTCMCNHCYV